MLFVAALPLPLFEEQVQTLWWVQTLEQFYLLLVWFFFFGWFWTHGGQTVGMKAWRMKLLRKDGGKPSWKDALTRFGATSLCFYALVMLVGLGALSVTTATFLGSIATALSFLLALIDQERRTWYDLLSGTQLVLVPRIH
jgi:uncharacterized RDD family membrane protein YckC